MFELYSYWRSSCSYRVRIALALKNLDYEYIAVHLVKNEQKSEEYKKINPNATVPTLILPDGRSICQSRAILEYLEECYPEISLLPKDLFLRAQVRAFVDIIVSDIQPVQNLRVLSRVDNKQDWAHAVISNGFEALEKILEITAGNYCFGDELTMADVVLVPQVYNAVRFQVDMRKFPKIQGVYERLEALEAFKKAHPDNQPDAQK